MISGRFMHFVPNYLMHPVKDGVHICDLNSCLRLQSMELRELLSWDFDN